MILINNKFFIDKICFEIFQYIIEIKIIIKIHDIIFFKKNNIVIKIIFK